MAFHNELGHQGEQEAIAHLRKKGYSILVCNYRYQKFEIDIIASKNDVLAIVEVKTRSSEYYGDPLESVDKKKEKMIAIAADHYVEQNDLDVEVRYDLISVIIRNGKSVVEHIEDAFYPFENL